MSIRWHTRLLVTAQILFFIPVILLWVTIHEHWTVMEQLALMVPLLLAAALAPFWIFGTWVPARCPHPGCGGRTYPGFPRAPENRLIYRCRACGRTSAASVRYDGVSID